MKYKPAVVSNALMTIARTRGIALDHQKIQKLLFFVHVWSLVLHGESVVDERPEAWEFGPIFDSLFYRLRHVREDELSFLPSLHTATGSQVPLWPAREDQRTWDIVTQVMTRYGRFTSLQVATLASEPGGPWAQSRAQQLAEIPDDFVKKFYADTLARSSDASA